MILLNAYITALLVSPLGIQMAARQFIDPLGGKLPALEQSILKLRAFQMVLVLHYAEELKRLILDLIRATDSLTILDGDEVSERVPEGTKNPVEKALIILVADNVITDAEKSEIVNLIDYRNLVAHQMPNLLADISTEPFARSVLELQPHRLPQYHHQAAERLMYFLAHFDRTHSYARTISMNATLFRSAEKTFRTEIRRLERKISNLEKIRLDQIQCVNRELQIKALGFIGDLHPSHPLNRESNGQLSGRGAELCYRLFDVGKSSMAVAHLMDLSIVAVRRRRQMWAKLGGAARPKVEFSTTRPPKFYSGNTGD